MTTARLVTLAVQLTLGGGAAALLAACALDFHRAGLARVRRG